MWCGTLVGERRDGAVTRYYENGTTREIFWRCIDRVLWAYEGASGASHSVALYIPEDHVLYRKHGAGLSS